MCSRGHKKLFRIDLGRTRYGPTWELQKRLLMQRADGSIPDCLITTEHEPVITMGRATCGNNLLVTAEELGWREIDLHEVERGGDITFHGPGQAVLYPIIDLTERGRDVRQYLRHLEQAVIDGLSEMGIQAYPREGMTGIWTNRGKIGAIGVAVSRWITYHGAAVNINTDLDYFSLINPCGITKYPVTSAEQVLGAPLDLAEATDLLVAAVVDRFGYEVETVTAEQLVQAA